MAEKARHAFGALERVDESIANGVIDSYDILFVKDAEGKPYVGWIDKDGNKVICDDSAELAELESELASKANAEEVAAALATKVSTEEIDAKIETVVTEKVETIVTEKVESTVVQVLAKTDRYEILDVPKGTLVDYNDKEIRIMCPVDTVWTKQTVGEGGDTNSHYMTFRTYVPNDDAVGYIEHLGDQVDSEILTDIKTDENGCKYQPTWLALAKYDEATDTWTYYGANSTESKYIGWDYQIDWFDADGVMIASDSIRINLSNEDCHSIIEPYYVNSAVTEKVEEVVETKVETIVETKVDEAMDEKVENAVNTANAYTDAKIAEISEAASYEIVEF